MKDVAYSGVAFSTQDGPVSIVAPQNFEATLNWLDDRLRRGLRGRLEAEFPRSLAKDAPRVHCVVKREGHPVAHAMGFSLDARSAAGCTIRLGLISLVYTEPAERGAGLASQCVEACVELLRERGRSIAMLWSDRPSFYERLGFAPCGIERTFFVPPDTTRRAPFTGTRSSELTYGPPCPDDWVALAELYDAKPTRADRAPCWLPRYTAAPDTWTVVARRGERAAAYAVLGRGDDFAGVIHEWAGDVGALLGCIQILATANGGAYLLAGPCEEPLTQCLLEHGHEAAWGAFSLARVLSTKGLTDDLGEEIALGPPAEILRDLFGAPEQKSAPPRFPLYLWGFDSI